MLYALTGATGFVGGALARRLAEAGHGLRCLVRHPDRSAVLSELGADLVPGDVGDAASLDDLCAGVDGLFHVAGWYRVGSRASEEAWRVNVSGTRSVLAAAARAAVPRIVYTSTLAVNSDTGGRLVDEGYRFSGRHLSVYDETKARAHDIAVAMAREGLPVVIVQPGLVYGPGDTSQTGGLVDAVVAGHRPLVPTGGGVCWGYVDDIARGHVLAMESGRAAESYMLAGPPAPLAEGLRIAAGVAATKGPLTMPTGVVRATAALAAVVEKVVRLPSGYAAETLRAATATYFGDPAKAGAELGWGCRSLDAGMALTVAARRSS
jgi:dihydroflavonol-4-reductase